MSHPSRNKQGNHTGLKIVVTVAAILAIGVKLYWPDLKIDGVVLGLFVVGTLPWLAPLIKAVELPGGLKIEMQEIKELAEEAKGGAESARQRAEWALLQTQESGTSSGITAAPKTALAQDQEALWLANATNLVSAYKTIRDSMASGAVRTQKMTEIVKSMNILACKNPTWNVAAYLVNRHNGWRLMAYCHIYALPSLMILGPLVDSFFNQAKDNKPFEQYWSIMAIQRVVGASESNAIPDSVKLKLKAFYDSIHPGTDRHYEMRRVLEQLKLV